MISSGRHPLPGHAHLRRPAHPAGPGLAPNRCTLSFPRCTGDIGRGHRRYLCAGDRVVGAVVLLYTDVGLKVRAMVDSPAMTDLSGTNPTAISVGVGRSARSSPAWPGRSPHRSSGSIRKISRCSSRRRSWSGRRQAPEAARRGRSRHSRRGSPPLFQRTCRQPAPGPARSSMPSLHGVRGGPQVNLVRRGRVGETQARGGALDGAITPQVKADWPGPPRAWSDRLAEFLPQVRRPPRTVSLSPCPSCSAGIGWA